MLLVALSALVPILLGIAPGDRSSPIRVFFDVTGERNLPTWWNAGLLLLAGVGSAAVGTLRRWQRVDRPAGWLSWWGLASVLGLMSLDEFAGFHERLDGLWRSVVGENPLQAYGWLLLGVPLAAAVVVFFWITARTLPRHSAVLYGTGLAVFFAGAIGVEVLTGVLLPAIGTDSLAYVALYHVEELLEFIGSAVLTVAPLAAAQVRSTDDGLSVRWRVRRRVRRAESA